jgi:hypothetical protein
VMMMDSLSHCGRCCISRCCVVTLQTVCFFVCMPACTVQTEVFSALAECTIQPCVHIAIGLRGSTLCQIPAGDALLAPCCSHGPR